MSEAENMQHRGTFESAYALKSDRYQQRKKPRLLDYCVEILPIGHKDYLCEFCDTHIFQVVDIQTRKKGTFEREPNPDTAANDAELRALIEGHFGVSAFAVSDTMWVVP